MQKIPLSSSPIPALQNATLIHTGEFPPSLGSFVTLTHPARGMILREHHKNLDKVHLDIVFGDCLALGGFWYAVL